MEIAANKFEASGRYNIAATDIGIYIGFNSRAKVFTNYGKQIIDVSQV